MRFRNPRPDDLDLNITPLIDIVFLLLIFFMVSTTFQTESQLRIQLPEAADQPAAEVPDMLELIISAEGQYALGDRELDDDRIETLIAALRDRVGTDRDQPLVIRADARTPHQAVVRAMDAAGRLGLVRISIATARPASGGEGTE